MSTAPINTFSRNDLLAGAANYRAQVEGQKGTATPYPARRDAEIKDIDNFVTWAKSCPQDDSAKMRECLDAKAAKAYKWGNIINKGSFFGGLGAVGLGAVAQMAKVGHPTIGLALELGGFVSLFMGGNVASVKFATYREAANRSAEISQYESYLAAHAAHPAEQPAAAAPVAVGT
jgi:hypothetical protein